MRRLKVLLLTLFLIAVSASSVHAPLVVVELSGSLDSMELLPDINNYKEQDYL